jgi:hypothetical protein
LSVFAVALSERKSGWITTPFGKLRLLRTPDGRGLGVYAMPGFAVEANTTIGYFKSLRFVSEQQLLNEYPQWIEFQTLWKDSQPQEIAIPAWHDRAALFANDDYGPLVNHPPTGVKPLLKLTRDFKGKRIGLRTLQAIAVPKKAASEVSKQELEQEPEPVELTVHYGRTYASELRAEAKLMEATAIRAAKIFAKSKARKSTRANRECPHCHVALEKDLAIVHFNLRCPVLLAERRKKQVEASAAKSS